MRQFPKPCAFSETPQGADTSLGVIEMPRYAIDINRIVTKEETQQMIYNATRARDSALVACLYLTGARPVEAAQLMSNDVSIDEPNNLFYIKMQTAKLGKTTDFFVPERILTISLDAPFARLFLEYVKNLREDCLAFPIKPGTIFTIIKKLSGGTACPYSFRHSRLTKLARENDATRDELMYWKGARDGRSVDAYISAKPIGRRLNIS